MHEKTIDIADYQRDEPALALVKAGSRGLIGHDLGVFIKRAGHTLITHLDEVRPGEVPVHLFAVGATEKYAFNRNGDAFNAATCRSQHPTFVKCAKFFRNHKNRDGDPSYGRVIASCFNEDMQRIELLVGLNGTKEAAERNGGFIADKELNKLEDGRDIGVSMGCKIAFDVCSFCGNQAPNRDHYCDVRDRYSPKGVLIPACSGFGCRTGLTKIASNGQGQFVENPNCVYTDISHVDRGAERIAFVTGRLDSVSLIAPPHRT